MAAIVPWGRAMEFMVRVFGEENERKLLELYVRVGFIIQIGNLGREMEV